MKPIKIDYTFTALDNIHTGADKSLGIYRSLYREKFRLNEPVKVPTTFPLTRQGETFKREVIAFLFFLLYERIPTKRTSIWEEVTDAILKISSRKTKEEIVNAFCEQFEIRSIVGREVQGWSIPKLLNLFDNRDLIETLRNEYHYIASLIYEFEEEKKEKGMQKQKAQNVDIFEATFDDITGDVKKIESLIAKLHVFVFEEEEHLVEYNYDYIPVIKGNSIRGILRDLAMTDYLKLIGLYENNKVDIHIFNRLFGGGSLAGSKDVPKDDAGKSGIEDLDLKESYLKNCPMFGLLGGAISSNQMIEGELRRVEYAVPFVKELGFQDMPSHHEITTRLFNVRQDDSKKTTLQLKKVTTPTAQMKFEYEAFVRNTKFKHGFMLNTHSKVRESAFWRLMKLFVESPYICAKSAIGLGKVDLSELESQIPKDAEAFYLDYIEEHKEAMQKFILHV